jgi:hypothetical protein
VKRLAKMRIFVAAAAALALGWLARRIGLADIAARLQNLRVVLPVVLLAGLIRLWLQTRAWRAALCAEGIATPQSRLVGVRLASQAAGYLAALGPVVSEPAKLVLLRNPAGMAAAAPATLVETGTYWFTTVLLGLAGTLAGAFLIADTRAVWAAAVVFGAALAVLVTRRSLLSPLVRAAGARAPAWLRSAETGELRIRSFRDRHPRATGRVLALNSVAQLMTLAEVAAVLWAVGIRPSPLHVLAIEAAGRMVKILGAWIPGRIGADEGGAAASFALLGLPPAAGLMLAVARRVRDLLWCGAGIAWAARLSARPRASKTVSSQVSLCVEER